MKNCYNCKHRDKFISQEPCMNCRFTECWECWEGEENESTRDNRASEDNHSR